MLTRSNACRLPVVDIDCSATVSWLHNFVPKDFCEFIGEYRTLWFLSARQYPVARAEFLSLTVR
jgi:hypothetical protein